MRTLKWYQKVDRKLKIFFFEIISLYYQLIKALVDKNRMFWSEEDNIYSSFSKTNFRKCSIWKKLFYFVILTFRKFFLCKDVRLFWATLFLRFCILLFQVLRSCSSELSLAWTEIEIMSHLKPATFLHLLISSMNDNKLNWVLLLRN